MIRRYRLWTVVAVLFAALNFAGAVLAAAEGEVGHAGAHVALTFLGAIAAWVLAAKRRARGEAELTGEVSAQLAERLAMLERSVEAVAIEVERIGEGQRYVTRMFAAKDNLKPSDEAPDKRNTAAE